MARIALIDRSTVYDGLLYRRQSLGGIQSGTVELAETFAAEGHDVTVFNLCAAPVTCEGVAWRPLDHARTLAEPFDLAIANNSARLLASVSSRQHVTWFRNRTTLWRSVRRRELPFFVWLRPHGVMLSRYHCQVVPKLLPLRSRQIIEHGTNRQFLLSRDPDALPPAGIPPPRAIFASQPYRGLDWIVDVWRSRVQPRVADAELHIFAPKSAQVAGLLRHQDRGIVVRGSVPPSELAAEFRSARVLLIPGHIDETYCRTAAEATASGLPLVTRGLGSLGERVVHGTTGWLAPDADAFAEHTVQLLTDAAQWQRMAAASRASSLVKSWASMAKVWARHFL